MHTEIKICGLSTSEAIAACADAGADLIGFIFFAKSPRNVTPSQAARLKSASERSVPCVAVSVNAEDDFLDEIVAQLKPDFLQLHGSETPGRVEEIKSRYALPIIKAFAIRTKEDFDRLRPYEGLADKFLLDAKAPEGSDLPGGNGVSFDWNLLAEQEFSTPYMLSGGLDGDNILEALQISGAKSIDISSGVESSPGVKDIAKIAAFIKTIRQYDLEKTEYATIAR